MARGTRLAVTAALFSAPLAAQAGPGGPRDSVVYVVAPESRFEVATGKSGLLGFAGHTHLIRARAVAGRIVYYPGEPGGSHVEIVVPADSLEVLTPPDTAEIRKVTEAMRAAVLHPDRYAEIRFTSTAVTPIPRGLRVEGDLTLEGRTRTVSVDLTTRIEPDTLRAAGTFSVKQTDFGIRPYRGGPAGTVRVADRVTFQIDAVLVRRDST